MPLRRLFNICFLHPKDLPPSRDDFEVIGAFNPGVTMFDGKIILLVRVAERPKEERTGYIGLPRMDVNSGLVVDWFPENDVEQLDPRVVRLKHNGTVRLNFVSHLRVLFSADGHSINSLGTIFEPMFEFEEYGVEDPRITFLDGRYYFTYVAVSRHGACTALAYTTDFQTFDRIGIIFCPENKDVLLFPEKIEGEYVALHRPTPAIPFSMPEIWLARSSDLIHWGRHQPLMSGISEWEQGRIGGGTPPIRFNSGWLEIYHGNRKSLGEKVGVYSVGAVLLDEQCPERILKRTVEPIMVPKADFELSGFVPNVIFPTGIVDEGDTFLVYYGSADTYTGVVEFSKNEILSALQSVVI